MPIFRLVAVANGTYVSHRALEQAVPDAKALATHLRALDQYEPVVLPSLERGPLLDAIEEHLGAGVLANGTLIVLWIGHGKLGSDNTLRLLGYSGTRDVELAVAGQLGEWAARTGARQALVLIDTCHSGGGLIDAVRLAQAIDDGRASPGTGWFGVLAASLADEKARSGALVREVLRVLKDGPRHPDFRWDKTRPFIRGDDLIQAILADWSEPRQRTHRISAGPDWDLVRNPRYEAGVPDQPVEHLLVAARGSSGDDSFFTGREAALAEIVNWLRQRTPGLFVVTGPPGCGKSAVAGRIVSLSSPVERAKLLAASAIPTDLDPGEGSVHAQLHARGVTVDTASEGLAQRLRIDASTGLFGVLGEARRRRLAGDPQVVVIDGVDEARSFSSNLAVELISPLAHEALVLVSTRDVPSGDSTLIAQFGDATRVLDLGQDVEGTRRDVRTYVNRRLAGVADTMDPTLVADELARLDEAAAAPFLLARLVTSQLRDRPVDTSSDGWRLGLATSVESALERDLQSVILEVGGTPSPTAATELIRALTYAYGGGFPADDVWPAVATAISPSGTTYTRDDAYAVLAALGRHIIAGSESDQPVYRIAHQRLVEYLRRKTAGAPADTATASVANAILAVYTRLLDAGFDPREHAYLWRYAWRHLAEAGRHGLAGLHDLVGRDRAAFLPDLATGLEFAAAQAWSVGQNDEALALIEEAVAVRRELPEKLKLAMALFHLAFNRITAGHDQEAHEAALEASSLAREMTDRPEAQAVLGATLLARATTELREGAHKAAKLLAEEAIALYRSGGVGDDEDQSAALAAACTVAGQAALALQDLDAASESLQQAVGYADRLSPSARARFLLDEALVSLATFHFLMGGYAPPGSDGAYRPIDVTAAKRILREYQELGARGSLEDVITARGLLVYVRARLVDRGRGLPDTDPQTPVDLLSAAIDLVRPYAEQAVDAAMVLAEALRVRAALQDELDPQSASSDLEQAERSLRRYAGQNALAGAQLGELLDLLTLRQIPQVREGQIPDLSVLIDRQREAVGRLRNQTAWYARVSFAGALDRLTFLLVLGRPGETLDQASRAEAIEAWRELAGVIPGAAAQLGTALSDQAARLLETRPAEAADLAREAVKVLEQQPQPDHAFLLATAELNLAAAQLNLGEADDTQELLRRAIARLDPPENPINTGPLAIALATLAHVEIAQGNFAEALPLAERAVALSEGPAIKPWMGVNRRMARLILGQAQRGIGQETVGTATLDAVIDELRASVRAGEQTLGLLARALNLGAPERWDEVLHMFQDLPEPGRILGLLRWRRREELSLTVQSILDALEAAEPTEVRTVRIIARQQRARWPREFDAAWHDLAGDIPDWFSLDLRLEMLAVAWWNTPTWVLSREYLKAHPELLDHGTDIVLDEFELEGMSADALEQHRALLADAREFGANAAYAPLLVSVEISDWMASDDPEAHLAEHEELLRPEIASALREDGDILSAQLAAILELAQRGERQLAFQTLKEPASMLQQLGPAWRSRDIARLAALATIARGADDPAIRRKATAALAIARVLEKRVDESEALMSEALEGSSELDRQEMVAIAGDAIASYPGAASELVALVQRVDSPRFSVALQHSGVGVAQDPL